MEVHLRFRPGPSVPMLRCPASEETAGHRERQNRQCGDQPLQQQVSLTARLSTQRNRPFSACFSSAPGPLERHHPILGLWGLVPQWLWSLNWQALIGYRESTSDARGQTQDLRFLRPVWDTISWAAISKGLNWEGPRRVFSAENS